MPRIPPGFLLSLAWAGHEPGGKWWWGDLGGGGSPRSSGFSGRGWPQARGWGAWRVGGWTGGGTRRNGVEDKTCASASSGNIMPSVCSRRPRPTPPTKVAWLLATPLPFPFPRHNITNPPPPKIHSPTNHPNRHPTCHPPRAPAPPPTAPHPQTSPHINRTDRHPSHHPDRHPPNHPLAPPTSPQPPKHAAH